jgi:hypothetical protein
MGNRIARAGTGPSGPDAYIINFTADNYLGGGNFADVYKIQKKDTKKYYAAKFIK